MSVLKIRDAAGHFTDIPAIRGINGKDGEKGDTGATGANGLTPTIGENGNWFIGDIDTGKPSRGEKGEGGGISREEVEAITGELKDLTTEDKTNLAAAINEINQLANDPKLNMPIYYLYTSIENRAKDMGKLITDIVNEGKYQNIILIYSLSGNNTIKVLESTQDMRSQTPKYSFRLVGDRGSVNLSDSVARGIHTTGRWTNNVYTCSFGDVLDRYPYLTVNNTSSYTPTKTYHPATKDYVDRTISNAISTSITSVLESEF